MTRLQVVHNKALRMIGDYDYGTKVTQLHQDNNIPTLEHYIKQQTRKFYSKATKHHNRVIAYLDQ